MVWIQANWPMLVGVLFGLSEVLALVPAIKANSVFQLIYGLLKSAKEKLGPAPAHIP